MKSSGDKSSDDNMPVDRPVLSATQARQAVTGHNVRYVLAAGLLGIIAAFVVLYLISFA